MRPHEVWQAALLVLAVGLLTRPAPGRARDAVTLATVEAWLSLDSTLALAVEEVPSTRAAGELVYDSGSGLRPVSTPGYAVLALPLIAPGHVLARDPLALSLPSPGEGDAVAVPGDDLRVAAYGALGPALAALVLALFLSALGALSVSRRAVLVSGAALAPALILFAGDGHAQLLASAGLAFALLCVARRERQAGRGAKSAPFALAAAVATCPEHVFLAIPVGVAFYLNERSWRRSPSRAMVRFIVPVALGLGVVAFGDLPTAAGRWDPISGSLRAPGLVPLLLGVSPFAVLALLGLPDLVRRSSSLAWIGLGIPATASVVYGGWYRPAPVDLLPALLPLGLALGCAIDRSRWAGVAAALLSASAAAFVGVQLASAGPPGSFETAVYPALAIAVAAAGFWLAWRGNPASAEPG